VHLQSDTFHSEHARFELDLAELLDRPLQLIQTQLAARPADAAYFVDFAARLKAHITQIAPTLDTGFCHGDFHGQNAHVDAELAITFFDFDCCGKGWRAYDLAVFFWQMRSSNQHQQRCAEFLRAYLAQRPLAEQDLAAIPYFVAIRHLWWIALIIGIAPSHGIGGINDRFWNHQLKFCRELDVECFTQNVREIYALPASCVDQSTSLSGAAALAAC
jgi:Ser/Thr protein kinase RdoA (MazF antagonist)